MASSQLSLDADYGGAGHTPVLLKEALEFMNLSPGNTCIDMTVGLGGHAAAILSRTSPSGRLLGLDRDAESLDFAARHLAEFGSRVSLAHSSFVDAAYVAKERGFNAVDAVLFDLGISSSQLGAAERGFSCKLDGPLDMRMNQQDDLTAADIVNAWSERELADILRQFGDEPLAAGIARAICRRRPLTTTSELAAVASGVYHRRGWRRSRMHPATRTFQALRMAVNKEAESLASGLEAGLGLLGPRGRMVVISFHSGEDRMVKRFFRARSGEGKMGEIVTKKPVTAGRDERLRNPRSRSAKLRAFERADG